MWTDQWDSGEVDHVIVMIMQDEDSMSEACHRQSLVPELNGPQLGTRFLPLLSKCVTNSPVHLLIKCCWQAQWCPAYQEQLGVQGLAQEHFNTGGSNRDPRDSWTPLCTSCRDGLSSE